MRAFVVLAFTLLWHSAAYAEAIDYKALYNKAAPAVVLVYGESDTLGSVGTGSIIRADGLIVTNAHVIIDHATEKPYPKLFVYMKPDHITGSNADDLSRPFQVQWLAVSPDMDLALLRMVNPPKNLPLVAVDDGSQIGVGEATAAIGHPEQGAKWSLTTGRIGGEFRDFNGVKGKDVYQMETSVNRGNSGGPLLDGNGFMIGINTSIARRAADGLAITGINFAIKSSVVRNWIEAQSQRIPTAQVPAIVEPPPPAVVVKAPPPPVTPEPIVPQVVQGTPPAPAREATTETVAPPPPKSGRVVKIAPRLPAAPPAPRRGYTTRDSGRTFSERDILAQHADAAFEELDKELGKRRTKKGAAQE